MERIDVAYVLIEERGRVLLVRNRAHGDLAGGWSLPGGMRESGETLTKAAVREALEETGLEVELGSLLIVCERIARSHDLFFVFRARIVAGTPTVPANDEKVVDVRWFEPEEADRVLPWYPDGVAGLLEGAEPRYYLNPPA